jgi:hypothetical protein
VVTDLVQRHERDGGAGDDGQSHDEGDDPHHRLIASIKYFNSKATSHDAGDDGYGQSCYREDNDANHVESVSFCYPFCY